MFRIVLHIDRFSQDHLDLAQSKATHPSNIEVLSGGEDLKSINIVYHEILSPNFVLGGMLPVPITSINREGLARSPLRNLTNN